jgi:hypothetical protein
LLLGAKLASYQVTCQVVFVRREADVQFFVECLQLLAAASGCRVELARFMLQQLSALLILFEGELHFAHGLPELQIRFFDTIEDRVEIGLKQSGKSSYQCHLVCSVVAERWCYSGSAGAV